MQVEEKHCVKLGRAAVEEIGSGPDEKSLAAQKRAIKTHLMVSGTHRSRQLTWAFVAGATAIASIAIIVTFVSLLFSGEHQERIEYHIGSSEASGQPGSWLEARSGHPPLEIRFEEGSVVELDPGSTGQIVRSDSQEVRLMLNHGKVHSTIKSRGRSNWIVQAGPYQVMAIGTEFFVSWQAEKLVLDVTVVSGVVRVKGGQLISEGVRLRAGQKLSAHRNTKSTQTTSIAPQTTQRPEEISHDEVGQEIQPPEETPQKNIGTKGPAAIKRNDSPQQPDWRALYQARDYQGTIEAAERQGLDQLKARLGPQDLLSLGNAARYARRPGLARSMFLTIRERFAGSGPASVAAFHLGRMAADQRGSPGEAARWFETYLRENQSGSLSGEARGRLVEIYQRSGQPQRAQDAARRYLRSHPQGPYRALSESVLAGETQER